MKPNFLKSLLTIACLLCCIGVYAQDFEVDGIYYNYSSTTRKAFVTYGGSSYDSYSNEYTGAVIIPESVTYNGTTYSVTSISQYAFYKCTGLTSVTIPNSVTSIGMGAFWGCTGLTEITIPNSVTSISNYAFLGCTGLTSMTIEDGNSELYLGYNDTQKGLFYDCPIETLYVGRNLSYDARYLSGYSPFYNIEELKLVSIGNSVTSIGDWAFYKCTGLTDITIGSCVTSIGAWAFDGCSGLTIINCKATTPPVISNTTFSSYTATLIVPAVSASAYKSTSYWCKFSAINKLLVDGLYYKILSETDVEVTNGVRYKGAVVIPETIKIKGVTYNVTSIGDHAFDQCMDLTEVTIPNSITSIGEYAFYNCTGLTEVTIPNSVISIGKWAFDGCTGLTTIYCLATTPPAINSSTFSNYSATLYVPIESSSAYRSAEYWKKFTSINKYLVDGLSYNILSTTDVEVAQGAYSDEVIVIPATIEINGVTYNITSIGKSAFSGCSVLEEVTIPNSVTSIGDCAFSDCTGLTEVTIPDSVTSIGNFAFSNCTGLTGVYITDLSAWCRIDFGGSNANPLRCAHNLYLNNELITNLVIPEDITSIGNYAFFKCTRLTDVTIHNSITEIGSYAFAYCTGLTEITIPNSITEIGYATLANCTGLTEITIPNSVTSIAKEAFRNCTALTEITIPNNINSICWRAFMGCTGLKSLTIEDGDSELELGYNDSNKGLFYDCPIETLYIGRNLSYEADDYSGHSPFRNIKELQSVTIGDSVTSIGDWAFYKCTGLKEVTIPQSVTSLGMGAFYECTSLTTVNFNAENCITMGTSYYPVFEGCSNLTAANIGESVKTIPASAFYECTGLTEVTIPNSVTSIGDCAFSDCTGLTEVTIPNSVTSIGDRAFYECTGLTEVTIGNSVTSIGDWAFSGCTGLTEVTIPESVTELWRYAFSGCTSLITVNFNAENCTTMGSYDEYDYFQNVFGYNRTLTTLYIGNKVKTIPNNAFSDCKVLHSVTIGCEVIEIGEKAFDGCDSIKIVNSYAKVPPTIYSNTFNKYVNDKATLHVVKGYKNHYAVANYWENFLNITDDLIFILSESIVLDHTNITAIEGETVVLTATIYPEDATEKGVVWSVSDATIATIEPLDNVSAKVTVLREGTATITATTIDGSNLTATCVIDIYSGIDSVEADAQDAEYYTIEGMKLAKKPARGIYIMKQGNTVKKVVL